ncbi:S41 family peptidase [uncultured Croceitalea sp.]|uniref:S41 family peptidase n=1 Tax=uncultured Croceitalea sp. TaxID=1798908 RepID=UPI003305932F
MGKINLLIALLLFSVFGYGQARITFHLDGLSKDYKGKVGLRGSVPPLDWSQSLVLEKNDLDYYSLIIDFPEGEQELEFKFVLINDDTNPNWEGIQNRTFMIPPSGESVVSKNQWNKEQVVDITSLKKIPSNKLLEDYALIEKMVLEVHPGTYRYNTREEILAALKKLKKTFSISLTHQEAYLAISKLTAKLKCDHTKAGFNNQSKIINSIIHYQKDKLPFTFKWIENEMVVNHNASENMMLQRGTTVKRINGIPVNKIKNELMSLVAADGATDGNRIYKLQVDGYDFRYNAFDIFYPLVFPIENNEVELIIQEPTQNLEKSIRVATISREDRAKILEARYPKFPKSRDDMWSFNILNEDVAVLKLNSFGLMGWKAMTLDYKKFLEDVFEELNSKKIGNLVIDIRENNGGNDEMADELFGYLAESSIKFDRVGRTRYVNFPEEVKPFVQSWGDNPWYFNLKPKEDRTKEGYYIFKENFDQAIKRTDKRVYMGKSYLLTSAANTSLAFYTAYRFKKQKLGLLIGQETGGNLNDINGGQILFLRLPHSQIEIDFPVMGGFSNQKQPNSGVIPDIQTKNTIQSFLGNRDLEMEKTLELIGSR